MTHARSLTRLLVAALPALLAASCARRAVEPDWGCEAIETRVLEGVNAHRVSRSLGALQPNDVLATQARRHSRDMADGRVELSHVGFNQRAAAIGAGIAVILVGENVAMNAGSADPAAAAIQSWMGSHLHRANLEGNFNLTGIGVARAKDGAYYFTQLFAKRQWHK